MSFIETIQKKSNTEKTRLIWIAVIVVAVLLLILWIFTTKIPKALPKDTSIFQTFGKGVHDIRQQYSH